MLAIFDIDGTLCDTQDVEGHCFAKAIEEVCCISLMGTDWSQFEEPTSSGIVRGMLEGDADLVSKERQVRDRFVELLKEAQPLFPGDFSPIAGATAFVERLASDPSVTVAIATGGFDTEALFKLDCCGIDLGRFPHATSSDLPRRKEIIPLTARRAGKPLDSAVYFGDAPWDVEACRVLGVPMIGIGRRIAQLKALGVHDTFPDFEDPEAVMNVMLRRGPSVPGSA